MHRNRLSGVVLAGAISLCAPCRAEGIDGCWVRVYEPAHLAQNPRQIIRRIQFQRVDPAGPDYGIRALLKNDRRSWDAGGPCKAEGAGFRCDLDGDNGHVRVTRGGETLRLEVVDYIGFEADGKNGDLDHKSFGDEAHKVFLLFHSRDEDCK